MVVGDKVILNVDQDDLAEVVAFDAKTGDLVWKKSRPAFRACYTTPFVLERDGKTEVIVGSTAGVTSYDPKDGAVGLELDVGLEARPGCPKGQGERQGRARRAAPARRRADLSRRDDLSPSAATAAATGTWSPSRPAPPAT